MVDLIRNDIPGCDSPEWEADWDDNTNTITTWLDLIAEEHNIENSVWSMWDVRDFNDVPFPDVMRMEYDGGWGEPCGEDIPMCSTWLDLWKVADRLIKKSGDGHHVFIESMYAEDNVIKFNCGS